jgi:hypothetical protein
MSEIEIVKLDQDSGEWSGRTALSGSIGDLREALFKAVRSDERTLGALFVLGWLDSWADYPPPRLDRVDLDRHSLVAGNGPWRLISPERPLFTAPLPFNFFLPTAGDAALDALEPWWRSVVPKRTDVAPLASYNGSRLDTGSWPWEGDRWASDPVSRLSSSASLRVYADHIQAISNLSWKTAAISPSKSNLADLVPGIGEYRSLKDFASMLSEKTENTTAGSRIPLSSIFALTFENHWSLEAPLLNFRLKRLVKSRGYGEHHRAEIGVEFSDGWRPCRICLVSELLPVESEDAPFEFFKSLVETVARDRCRSGEIDDADRDALASSPELHESSFGASWDSTGGLAKRARVELPGHRPIGVESPA